MATLEEVESNWPGGAENPDRGYDGWIDCYAALKSFARRIEREERVSESTRAALAAAQQRAAAREPVPVQLSVGPKAVHQKSAWALWYLESLDGVAQSALELANELSALPEIADLRGLPPLTVGLAWRTWAWILTHPDVGLPFNDAESIDPPTWTEQLLSEDFIAIYAAHRALHFEDLAVMAGAFPPEGRESSRLYLGGFLSSFASEHDKRASTVIRQWGLPEVYAQAIATAEQHRVAKVNAKAAAGSAS